jgi:hypothetical protein
LPRIARYRPRELETYRGKRILQECDLDCDTFSSLWWFHNFSGCVHISTSSGRIGEKLLVVSLSNHQRRCV